MNFSALTGVTNLDDRRRQMAERDFDKAAEEVLNCDNLTAEQMIELFDEDGYLGTAMRQMLEAPKLTGDDLPDDWNEAA